MKVIELAKIYTSSTNQVAAKQRWSHGGFSQPREFGMSMLAKLLEHSDVQMSRRDVTQDAVDGTPRPDAPLSRIAGGSVPLRSSREGDFTISMLTFAPMMRLRSTPATPLA